MGRAPAAQGLRRRQGHRSVRSTTFHAGRRAGPGDLDDRFRDRGRSSRPIGYADRPRGARAMSVSERVREEVERSGQGAYVESFEQDAGRMTINMGPVHPATHGVLRLVLELDGETVMSCRPHIGYLHTGMEKECEDQNWRGAVTIVTRMDYLAQMFNEQVYSLAVEDLLGIEVPPRGKCIRTLITEVNWLSSHLVYFGTQGLDMGAMSAVFYGFRERELILDFFEMVTGLRMNNGYVIPGGVWEDLPEGWERVLGNIVDLFPKRIDEYEELLSANPIF